MDNAAYTPDFRHGEAARAILSQQNPDGTWGTQFHTLSVPDRRKGLLTTEQALRRLHRLGFTIEDEPVRRAVDCMSACLRGERKIDDYWEKTHDWALFTRLMLSAWVRMFQPENAPALEFARLWAQVIGAAFQSGGFDGEAYAQAYGEAFHSKQRGAREKDFAVFYHVALLRGVLAPETEGRFVDHILSGPSGIYYIYEKPLARLPEAFATREASRYLAALELLAEYPSAREKLGFAADWLAQNQDENGQWDFGPKARDGVYFPLSDSWRKAADRRTDCTWRCRRFLDKLAE